MSNQKITDLSSLSQSSLDAAADFLLLVDSSNTSMSTTGTNVKITPKNLVSASLYSVSFESISKNLQGHPFSINYADGNVSSIVYSLPGDLSITKTFYYTDGKLTSIVLSGNVPSGIALTKTLNYSDGNIIGASYS